MDGCCRTGAGIKPLKDEEAHYELIKEAKVFYNDLTYPEICMKGMKIAHDNHVATVLNIQTGLSELEARRFSKQNLLEAIGRIVRNVIEDSTLQFLDISLQALIVLPFFDILLLHINKFMSKRT